MSIHYPLGFNWHPLEGAGMYIHVYADLNQKKQHVFFPQLWLHVFISIVSKLDFFLQSKTSSEAKWLAGLKRFINFATETQTISGCFVEVRNLKLLLEYRKNP